MTASELLTRLAFKFHWIKISLSNKRYVDITWTRCRPSDLLVHLHLLAVGGELLLFDKDRIISVESAAVVLGQIRLPEGEEGALGMSSTSSLTSLTG